MRFTHDWCRASLSSSELASGFKREARYNYQSTNHHYFGRCPKPDPGSGSGGVVRGTHREGRALVEDTRKHGLHEPSRGCGIGGFDSYHRNQQTYDGAAFGPHTPSARLPMRSLQIRLFRIDWHRTSPEHPVSSTRGAQGRIEVRLQYRGQRRPLGKGIPCRHGGCFGPDPVGRRCRCRTGGNGGDGPGDAVRRDHAVLPAGRVLAGRTSNQGGNSTVRH